MNMQDELEKKLMRVKAEYQDGELPMKARHALDLLEDITVLLFAQQKWLERIGKDVGVPGK